jgi:hypothetical protein
LQGYPVDRTKFPAVFIEESLEVEGYLENLDHRGSFFNQACSSTKPEVGFGLERRRQSSKAPARF